MNFVNEIPSLETKRLILRAFMLSDAADVQRLAGEREIADTTLNIPHPYKDGQAEDWIKKHQPEYENGTAGNFVITLKSNGSLLGAISLLRMIVPHKAEIGYWIGKPFWSHGYCTEAAHAVLEYGFSVAGLQRIYAHHMSRNKASGRVMKKIGMQHEGCLRHHIQKWGKLEDCEVYGILKEEWQRGIL